MNARPGEISGADKITGDNTPLAVAVIIFTVFALAFGDALIKRISAALTLWQIFSIRSLLVIPLLAAYVFLRQGRLMIWPRRPGWTTLRSLMLAFMWVAYYTALPHLDLSIAAASYYTLPLFIALFAAIFLGEYVGRSGWAAMAIGFLGVVLILKPDAGQFNWYALLPDPVGHTLCALHDPDPLPLPSRRYNRADHLA